MTVAMKLYVAIVILAEVVLLAGMGSVLWQYLSNRWEREHE